MTTYSASLPRAGIVAFATLLVEYPLLSLLFDLAMLREHDRPWAFLGYFGDVLPIAFVGVAVALSVRSKLLSQWASWDFSLTPEREKLTWIELGLGTLAYGLFLLMSRHVLNFEPPSVPVFLGWFGLALVWIFCRVHWLFPPESLASLPARLRAVTPILLIALLALGMGFGTRALWDYQSATVLGGVVWLLRLVGEEPELAPGNELWLQDFGVNIAPTCSGYEGLGLMCAFLGGFIVVMRRDLILWRAWLILPLALLCVWSANLVRLAALTWIGAYISPDWASGAFHSRAGWLLFCAIGLVGVAVVQKLAGKNDGAEPAQPGPAAAERPITPEAAVPEAAVSQAAVPEAGMPEAAMSGDTQRATYYHLAPLVAASGVTLLTGLIFEPLDRLYALRVITAAVVLYVVGYRPQQLRSAVNVYSVGTGLLVLALWLWLSEQVPAEQVQLFAAQLQQMSSVERSLWFAFRIAGSVLMVPIIEELAFRGYLMRRLATPDFARLSYQQVPWWSVAVTGALFAVLHGSMLAGLIAGLIYGALARLRGNLSEVVVAHAVTNAGLCVLAVVRADPALWL